LGSLSLPTPGEARAAEALLVRLLFLLESHDAVPSTW
jgi:hypothetical protein